MKQYTITLQLVMDIAVWPRVFRMGKGKEKGKEKDFSDHTRSIT